MAPSTRKLKICTGFSVAFAVVLFAIGIGGPYFLEYELQDGIKKKLVVTGPESSSYGDFTTERTASNPMYRNMFFFNLTNPDAFLAGGIPEVEQIGPFAYREIRQRFNITFSEDKNQATYYEQRYYTYVPDKSCSICTPDLNITTINVPEQSVQNTIRLKDSGLALGFWGQLLQSILMAAEGELPIVTKTADELLWGYQDQLLKTLSSLQPGVLPYFQGLQENVTSKATAFPPSTIWTGNDNVDKTSQFVSFRNMTELPYWVPNTWASKVKGSDGTQHKLNVQTDDILFSFSQDVALTVNLTYQSTYKLKDIKLYRFGIPPTGMLNATSYPGNADIYNFMPNGLTNVTSVHTNAPIFLSKPQFLDADPVYRRNVSGLHPVRALHDTFVDVEPITGTTMNAQQRLQINIHCRPLIGKYSTMPEVVLPVMWVEETSTVSDSLANEFKDTVYLVRTLEAVSMWVGLVMGALLTVITGALLFVLNRRRKNGSFQSSTRLLKGEEPINRYDEN